MMRLVQETVSMVSPQKWMNPATFTSVNTTATNTWMEAKRLKRRIHVVMNIHSTANDMFRYISTEMISSVSQEAYPAAMGKTRPEKFASRMICLTRFMAGICSVGP